MSLDTYRLEIRESETGIGIEADVYDDDGTIQESTSIRYDEYGLEPAGDRPFPDSRHREITTDVTTLDLQVVRDGAGFEFRLLGDREELVTERIEDEAWSLQPSAE